MAPVIRYFSLAKGIEYRICVSAQHREMLDQVLELFDIQPDYDLDIMKPGQHLVDASCRILKGVSEAIADCDPSLVIVHGDTATCFMATLAAYYSRVPVAHIEAGLRTGNLLSPWPEEGMRKLTGAIATLHFAPTGIAQNNLERENIVDSSVVVTGNTVIDALLLVKEGIENDSQRKLQLKKQFDFLDEKKRMILVTGHRRESFGDGFKQICQGISNLAQRKDIEIVYPVHLNPEVRLPVNELLAGRENVHLIEPLSYVPFVYLMMRSSIILTDSGGIQEEAPSLGKPVLVMRETTERPEAVSAGTVELVGTSSERIVRTVCRLLDNKDEYQRMSMAHNPYGDGSASKNIYNTIKQYLGKD